MMQANARLFHTDEAGYVRQEVVTRENSGLEMLTYAQVKLAANAAGVPRAWPDAESLYIVTAGGVEAVVAGHAFVLATYDALYVPVGASHSFRSDRGATLAHFTAPATGRFAPYATHYSDIARSGNDPRVRKLKGKDIVVLCGEQDDAEKLTGGLTFFEAVTRSFPPHKHEDQEEIYLFLEGHGAMEVYADEESKSFVRDVKPGDAVTIPKHTYHPVFSFGEPLVFAWVIAGSRYWVGDRDADFMKGARANEEAGEA